ncbi:hypothetical protein HA052_11160 [Chromobacterium haemolyticum]|uniref:ASCH domain-containing protein n=1 Tax=Chromobacterium fluminis TaxID=3044269 RepID=A0ABX0L8E7_9NEIS|nr:hypothetical protein [Chromobacterium haemolyticum]NHR05759.1 hypothetical protein [Chromobacterium haemolyticum]
MKERPMLYTGAMVRKVLADAKTQTRRVVKGAPSLVRWNPIVVAGRAGWEDEHGRPIICPYGEPGDRLWVRETWGVISHSWDRHGNRVKWTPNRPATAISEMPFGNGYYSGHVIYAADGPNEWSDDDDGGGEPRSLWHPSIHMPRAACRLMLEITDVRVERLQDISEADAVAEGGPVDHPNGTARGWFEQLWEKLYGAGSWDANPYVWRISFKRVER